MYLLIKCREHKYLSFPSTLIMLRFSRLLYFAGYCIHAQLCPNLCNPWTVALQAPVSMGFSRQEGHRGGLPSPTPEISVSPALAGGFFSRSFITMTPGQSLSGCYAYTIFFSFMLVAF